MENNQLNTPSGGRAPKQFSDVPASRKAADLVQWLEEHKALRVVSIDFEGQGGFADALIIASAGSVRHAQSLADGVSLMCREKNYEFLRTEGYAAMSASGQQKRGMGEVAFCGWSGNKGP